MDKKELEHYYGKDSEQITSKLQELGYMFHEWNFGKNGVNKHKKKDLFQMNFIFFSYMLEFMALSKLMGTRIYDSLSRYHEDMINHGASVVVDGKHMAIMNKAFASFEESRLGDDNYE